MKKSFFLKLAGIAVISLLSVSCKKKSDPTPAPAANAKVFSTTVIGNNATKNITGTVTVSDGVAYLKVYGSISSGNINHVYITTSQDNGAMSGYVPTDNFTDSLKNTFNAGGNSGASYTVSNTKSFVLTIPVPVRTSSSAVSDVYRIWFTDGKGAFTLPTKNSVLGPVTFTLNYVANAGPSYTTNTGIVLGDQTNLANGSLLVTGGQISALTTALYDSSATSAEISLSALDATGTTKTNQSGILWFVSPSLRVSLGYVGSNEPNSPNNTSNTTSPNVTYISAAPSTINFNSATGTDLTNLSVGNSMKVQIGNGGVYQFKTSDNKQGLILVTALNSNTTSSGSTATVSVKVLN
jgi:hypothetical protein